MTERERTDFLSGDKNNDHFYKRSQTTPPIETAPAKKHIGSLPQLSYKTGNVLLKEMSMLYVRPISPADSRFIKVRNEDVVVKLCVGHAVLDIFGF